jgi:hypothetical protein
MLRQIASELKLDFKTIIHHVKLLTENRLVITENKESHDILSDTINGTNSWWRYWLKFGKNKLCLPEGYAQL